MIKAEHSTVPSAVGRPRHITSCSGKGRLWHKMSRVEALLEMVPCLAKGISRVAAPSDIVPCARKGIRRVAEPSDMVPGAVVRVGLRVLLLMQQKNKGLVCELCPHMIVRARYNMPCAAVRAGLSVWCSVSSCNKHSSGTIRNGSLCRL